MNMKKLVAGVLACCIVGGAMPSVANFVDNAVITASAEGEAECTKGEYEQFIYRKYSDYIEISRWCDVFATEVEIPVEIEGLSVKSIGAWAFNDCIAILF